MEGRGCWSESYLLAGSGERGLCLAKISTLTTNDGLNLFCILIPPPFACVGGNGARRRDETWLGWYFFFFFCFFTNLLNTK